MTTPLQQAAKAVIDKFEQSHPLKELAILELHKALVDELQQSVEPVGYTYAHQDFVGSVIGEKGEWAPHEIPLYLHPPQQQLRECWYESDELKVCRKCGQLHDKAIPPQQAIQGEKP